MANGSTPSLPAISGGGSNSTKEYNRQLTALNCSVRDWITKHVNDNPLCDLNPIFRDYERHLATIESKYGSSAAAGEEQQPGKQANTTTNTPLSFTSSNVTPAAPALLSFTKNKDSAAPEKSSSIPAGVTFNFGQKVDSSVLSSLKSTGASGFSFSSTSTTSSTTSLFGAASTGTSAGTFSFTAAKTEAASNSQAAGTHFDEWGPSGCWAKLYNSSCC